MGTLDPPIHSRDSLFARNWPQPNAHVFLGRAGGAAQGGGTGAGASFIRSAWAVQCRRGWKALVLLCQQQQPQGASATSSGREGPLCLTLETPSHYNCNYIVSAAPVAGTWLVVDGEEVPYQTVGWVGGCGALHAAAPSVHSLASHSAERPTLAQQQLLTGPLCSAPATAACCRSSWRFTPACAR